MRNHWVAALAIVGLSVDTDTPQGPSAILGWWHGTSICTKAPWNAGCNDEIAVYEFVAAPPDSDHAILHGFKVVQGQLDSMGDLPMVYAPDSAVWHGDFANGRVSIRWSFRVQGDTLLGQLVDRPSLRVSRTAKAVRGKGQ
jgi:hypothetical protein